MTFDTANPESSFFKKPNFDRNPALKYFGYNENGTKNTFGKIMSWMPNGAGVLGNLAARELSSGTDTGKLIAADTDNSISKFMSWFDVAKIAGSAYAGDMSGVASGTTSLAQNLTGITKDEPISILDSPSKRMMFKDGGSFEKAFANARKELGSGSTFKYKGGLYTTNYKEEVSGKQGRANSVIKYNNPSTDPVISGRGIEVADVSSIKEKIASAETSGEANPYLAINKTSGAIGKYQFLPSTLKEMGITDLEAFRRNPKLQEQVMDRRVSSYILPKANEIVSSNPELSLIDAAGGIHFLGNAGFRRSIKNKSFNSRPTANNPTYNMYRQRMNGNFKDGGSPEKEGYKVYGPEDDSEDISLFDNQTGKFVGQMRWGELIFDQEAKNTIDSLIKKGDFMELGKFVHDERKGHKNFVMKFKEGGTVEDPDKLLKQLQDQLAKAEQSIKAEEGRRASESEKKKNLEIQSKKVAALKNAIFSLSPSNMQVAGPGAMPGQKSQQQKIKEAQKYLNEYKNLSGVSIGSSETSAAAKADYPIVKRSTGGNTLRFREMGNGVYQRDNGSIYLKNPADGELYGSNSNTYKSLLTSTYTMDSDGIPYIKIPAKNTTGRTGSGSGSGSGSAKKKPINIKDILGGTIGGTGKNQRAFISDPNSYENPPELPQEQLPLNTKALELGNPNLSKIAQAKGNFAKSISGDSYVPDKAVTGRDTQAGSMGELNSFIKNVVPNLGRIAVAAASYDGSNQQYERSPEWNDYVSNLKQQTLQGTDPLLLSNIGRQYGMQLSAIRSAGGGGMTGGALAGVLSNTASQLNDSVLAADREAFMRRYNALGMYGNALSQNESTRLMNFQNSYNKTQQQNMMAGQLAQSAIDDISLRNESDKTAILEEEYLKSLVDNQKQVSELLKRQTNALFQKNG